MKIRYSWLIMLLVVGLAVGLTGCLETEEDGENSSDPVGPVEGDLLEISRPGVNFHAQDGSAMLTLTYNGNDTLYWTAESFESWIDVNPGMGMFTENGDESPLIVTVDRDGMAVGEHQGLVTVSSVDETISFYVKMTVEEPEEPEEEEIFTWSTPQIINEGTYSYSEEYENQYQQAEYRVEFEVTEITGDFGVELILLSGAGVNWNVFTSNGNYQDHGSLIVTQPGSYELTSDLLMYNESLILVVDYSALGQAQPDGGNDDYARFTMRMFEKQVPLEN